MYIGELVNQHGLGIWVSCNKIGYPEFQVVEKLEDVACFKIKYADGHELILSDILGDYEVISTVGGSSVY